jgi:hypothetical protein
MRAVVKSGPVLSASCEQVLTGVFSSMLSKHSSKYTGSIGFFLRFSL